MKILLTNDDGIHARGLWALYDQFAADHEVTVIAPDRERSAVSHGITLHMPLRANRVFLNGDYSGYAVNGTPADCIKLALFEILEDRPDLVISGINPGANVGVNINYSGTVAAAREAALAGVAAMAVSIEGYETDHVDDAAHVCVQIAEIVSQNGLPAGTFLNINMPNIPLTDLTGIQICRQGVNIFSEYVEKRTDPRNRTYYWQGRDSQTFEDDLFVDGAALRRKFISITPIKCDMTDYLALEDLKGWELDISDR